MANEIAAAEVFITHYPDSYTVHVNNKPIEWFLTEFPTWEQLNGTGVYEVTLRFMAHTISQTEKP